MKFKALLSVIFVLAFAGIIFAAGGKMGPEDMTLHGGKKGNVPFPHGLHQKALGDCNACHDLFAKEHGIIQSLIKEGKLKKKKVMNMKCVKCHKSMAKAGVKTGPTKCSTCHIK